ncbi:MAG TPA: ROK family protein [Planctomycetaceae bacterium]|nr:ROK family protein [Planctomycetaceae bacterium]
MTEPLPNRVIPYRGSEWKVNKAAPQSILTVDIGGSKIKCLLRGQTEPRRFLSGREMTPPKMIQTLSELTSDWEYEAVSMGYPGLVGSAGPISEPGNLGPGWVGFDYAAAFDRPVRILNDAALQALGSYEGGRMLFLGLGTGLGSTLISQNTIIPLELGCLPSHLGKTCGEILSRRGLRRLGKRVWRAAVKELVHAFLPAFEVDYVVLGGGNAKLIKDVPAGARVAHNQTAFRGGFRLWHSDDIQTLESTGQTESPQMAEPVDWRVLA